MRRPHNELRRIHDPKPWQPEVWILFGVVFLLLAVLIFGARLYHQQAAELRVLRKLHPASPSALATPRPDPFCTAV